MTKRFNIEFDGHQYFLILDEVNERCLAKLDTRIDALAWLEMYKMLSEENEQLKSFNQDLSENLSVCTDKRLAQGEYLTKLNNENEQLKEELKELKIDNKAKDDAIDGLQSMMAHYNLEDLE